MIPTNIHLRSYQLVLSLLFSSPCHSLSSTLYFFTTMTNQEATTDPDFISKMQTLLESPTLAVRQNLQKYMSTVDSRFEELRSQISSSIRVLGGSSRPPASTPSYSTTVPTSSTAFPTPSTTLVSSTDNSPLLRSMKMEVPKFDGIDLNGWDFRINEFFFIFMAPQIIYGYILFLFTWKEKLLHDFSG